MTDALAASLDMLRAAGFAAVDVPVLLPMGTSSASPAKNFRRRIFVTTDSAGTDWCLRPEFTIPVCRKGLQALPDGGTLVLFRRIFRNGRPGENHEVCRSARKIVGRHDAAAADAEALRLALDVAGDYGFRRPP